jgi:hypothetical protein
MGKREKCREREHLELLLSRQWVEEGGCPTHPPASRVINQMCGFKDLSEE